MQVSQGSLCVGVIVLVIIAITIGWLLRRYSATDGASDDREST